MQQRCTIAAFHQCSLMIPGVVIVDSCSLLIGYVIPCLANSASSQQRVCHLLTSHLVSLDRSIGVFAGLFVYAPERLEPHHRSPGGHIPRIFPLVGPGKALETFRAEPLSSHCGGRRDILEMGPKFCISLAICGVGPISNNL